jgi:hypothetical protein
MFTSVTILSACSAASDESSSRGERVSSAAAPLASHTYEDNEGDDPGDPGCVRDWTDDAQCSGASTPIKLDTCIDLPGTGANKRGLTEYYTQETLYDEQTEQVEHLIQPGFICTDDWWRHDVDCKKYCVDKGSKDGTCAWKPVDWCATRGPSPNVGYCLCAREMPASCGNGICDASETALNCSSDCSSRCGDGVCQPPETNASCPQDCHWGGQPGQDGGSVMSTLP